MIPGKPYVGARVWYDSMDYTYTVTSINGGKFTYYSTATGKHHTLEHKHFLEEGEQPHYTTKDLLHEYEM